MPHLLQVWPSVSDRLRGSGTVLLLLDYDGTLTSIVSQPDLAILAPNTRALLRKLSLKDRYIPGIISGRSLQDVSALVDVPGLIYAGNHGLEIQGPGIEFVHPGALELKDTLAQVLPKLREELGSFPGVLVEDKGLTLSVHLRLTPEAIKDRVEAGFMAILEPLQRAGAVRVTRGKEVLEARPNVDWDKGRAIEKLGSVYQETSIYGAPLTVFFGDDVTDEDGFDVVQSQNGIAVFVGPARQPTRAFYRVDSPGEVREALQLMCSL